MDFMDIWFQKEATWNTLSVILSGGGAPKRRGARENSPLFPRLDGPVFSRFSDIACFVYGDSHLFRRLPQYLTPIPAEIPGFGGVPYGVDLIIGLQRVTLDLG